MVEQALAEMLSRMMGQTFLSSPIQDGIIATPGGGKANALPLPSQVNRIVTVATTNDAVSLPSSIPGSWIVIINYGANTLAVFTNGTDIINKLSYTAGYAVATGHTAILFCVAAGFWHSISGS